MLLTMYQDEASQSKSNLDLFIHLDAAMYSLRVKQTACSPTYTLPRRPMYTLSTASSFSEGPV